MTKINQEEYEVLKESLSDAYEWIARDSHNSICAHCHKPVKQNYWIQLYQGDGENGYKEIDGSLFQFIQWEDEEPHNIAELIKEYEEDYKGSWEHAVEFRKEMCRESEEIEVKKDKQWLINKVRKACDYEDDNRLNIKSYKMVDLINQLDEPETLSQEWLVEHSYNVHFLGTPDVETIAIPRDDLEGILVPKQELPVIPKFVANWIEGNKKHNKTLVFAIAYIYDKNGIGQTSTEEEQRLLQWMEAYVNEEVFARAWLDGFTVEEEQKYYAKAKGWELFEKNSRHPYWNVLKTFDKDERLTISTFGRRESLTKEEWNNLGLNENNADFLKAEELEE